MNLFVLILSLFQLVHPQKNPVKPTILASGFVYESAPFPQCHASTLLETPSGIMAAWFGGTHERHPDVSIYTSKLSEGAWSTPQMVADGVENENFRNPTWNPVLHRMEDGKIILFYKEGPNPREWWGLYKISEDEGKTWCEEIQTPPGFLGPVKNKSIVLPDGRLLHPSSFEINRIWTSHVEITDPELKTWRKSEIDGNGFGAIQPTTLRHPNGRLQLLFRTQQGEIATSSSSDNGNTWSKMASTGLAHNNSGIDAVTLKNGYHLLVCNPIKKGRNKISLFGSPDGITWEELLVLEDESEGEFSYPAIIEAKDGTVHISYTYNRVKVKYIHLKV
jgi:alpha-L-fucosidase